MKYISGISSDDNLSNNEYAEDNIQKEMQNSINQLARGSRICSKGADKKKILLFVADRHSCKEIYKVRKIFKTFNHL